MYLYTTPPMMMSINKFSKINSMSAFMKGFLYVELCELIVHRPHDLLPLAFRLYPAYLYLHRCSNNSYNPSRLNYNFVKLLPELFVRLPLLPPLVHAPLAL